MDSTVIEGASHNPYGPYVQDYANVTKTYSPTEFRFIGKYQWIEISESTTKAVRQALFNIQKAVLPTISKFTNDLNISQLQGRVYRKLKIYEDEFNVCHIQARTPSDAEFCANQLINRLQNDMMTHVKNIVDEY